MAAQGSRSQNVHGAEDDLAALKNISDDIIVSTLRERFLSDNIYTALGSNALVALNPHKFIPANADSALVQYAAEYRDTAEERTTLPPHIFQLANNAYYHMRRTNQDQSIMFSGETGSGKSESRRLAIKSIIELSVSNPGKKGAKLGNQIPSAEYVLESFGSARTLFNPNASRFGKYTELQFSDRGRLAGVKTLDYYLERNRVAGAPSGERNFHIFYYLLVGASQEERQHLHLNERTVYRYLTHGGGNPYQEDDGPKFERLKQALKTVGFSKRSVAQTCQLIAAILHLGNIEFTRDKNRNVDAAVVKNTDVLAIVSDFLGVQPRALEQVLSYKTKLVKNELLTIFLDAEGASDNRDDLAKNLYSLLFSWLNEYINEHLSRDDYSTFIGLFDLPGFQNITSSPSRSNSLDQFAVNYANERMQRWIQKRIFERPTEELASEGLGELSPPLPFFDNSECVRMLSTMPGGLIHIMDDQARRAPRKTEHTMVEAMSKRWGSHTAFKTGGGMDHAGFPTFTINHYNGAVTYSSESFLDKNADALNPDFVSLLRTPTSGGANVEGLNGSTNPFIQNLFSGKALATEAHPRNDETLVAAHQPAKPMRAPSTRRKQTIKRNKPAAAGAPGAGGANKDIQEEGAEGTGADGAEDEPAANEGIKCVAGEFQSALDTLFTTLDDTHAWFVFCVNPNDSQLPNQLEGRGVKAQVRSVGLAQMARKQGVVFEASMTPMEFCDRYSEQMGMLGVTQDGEDADRVLAARDALGLQELDVVLGQYKVFLSHEAFRSFEDHLRGNDAEEQKRNRLRAAELEAGLDVRQEYAPYSPGMDEAHSPGLGGYGDPFGQSNQALPLVDHAADQPYASRAHLYGDLDDEDGQSLRTDDESRYTSARDAESNFGSESYAPSRNMFHNAKKAVPATEKEPLAGEIMEGEVSEEVKDTSTRRRWLFAVWALTWWLPNPCLTYFGRMKRLDIRQAWREKLAINMIIWFFCACSIFVIAILGRLICPTEYVFSTSELQSHSFNNDPGHTYTAIRGEVFDLTGIFQIHLTTVSIVPQKTVMKYGGTDSTSIFPVQVSALCDGKDGSVNPYVILDSTNQTVNTDAVYHDFRAYVSNDYRPDWYYEQMILMRWNYRHGFVGYQPSEISTMASKGQAVAVYNGLVYDLTNYIKFPPTLKTPDGTQAPTGIDTQFMDSSVVDLFSLNNGQDITKKFDNLNIDGDLKNRMRTCLRNLFLIGRVDNRNSPQCLFSQYILLALSCVMVAVIGFKFIASISFGSPRAPEDHDKFVCCQVPCYTEDEDSIRRTVESLAKLKYDDKRKLIFIICDGNIVGSGNDRPTPRIVLDVLGADPNLDPEPLSFLSLGDGAKQHNMGKVYSGLYECAGHVVPYVVVVKVGKPTERSRPGNRGKRDSQMLLMHFLNKVHFNAPMNPLELEIYHQIKNVIGVNPSFYEYLLMVDADTTVEPLSLNRLVSAMVHDKKLLGVCGETSISNSRKSIVTMMQVYEYFLSHHLAKAFESLFGSVTCLPGCFTMYRLRTPDTHKPLFISNQVIHDYSENRVDTLHMKNLLHLGEDRRFDPRVIPLKTWTDYENELWDKESNHSVGSWVPPAKGKDGYDSRTASLYGRETYYDAPPQLPHHRSMSPAPSYAQSRMQSQYGFPQAHPADPFGRQSMASRPVTSYLPELHSGGEFGGHGPSDAELDQAVQEILRDADLTVSTKRVIRAKLEEMFGMDLSSRKMVINAAIDRALLNA
ncbi:glycosyltransferase family 2 protein [Clavulina sp. PMI_390]|nr:glycosyltransferase family 2 protein [Clavulina sp. PMI_390]